MTFQQLDLLIDSAVSPPPLEEKVVVEETVEETPEIVEAETDESPKGVDESVEHPEDTEVLEDVLQEEGGFQFLVSPEELPAQDPVTESDLLAILTRNSIAGLDQGVDEEVAVNRPAPPISFISPSLVESNDDSRGSFICCLTCSRNKAKETANPKY
jgi:hypothetical protein